MKILWITNIPFPVISRILEMPVEIGGGWMHSLALQLVKDESIQLAIGTTFDGDKIIAHSEGGLIYYLLPRCKPNTHYDSSLESRWAEIVKEFKPDVIHIHGTEYAHGLACMKACPKEIFVVSIQGLISVYADYFSSGIKPFEFIKYTTLNDIKRMDTMIQSRYKLERRSKIELEYIKLTRNIIGRTSWDYTHTKAINPGIKYHFCNEVLRESFYNAPKWSIREKRNHSIFMSQANTQRQGLHQLLKAISLIKDYYPDVHLRVAGLDVSGGNKWVQRIGTYGHYIRSLLASFHLEDTVQFLGGLNEERMSEEFKNAHVFACASVIENSPNSLGEAQLIGTPCVASFVGGIPDMVIEGETGLLFRFEEYRMLALKIMQLFDDDKLAETLSVNSQKAAAKRHDRSSIVLRMKEIYSCVQ